MGDVIPLRRSGGRVIRADGYTTVARVGGLPDPLVDAELVDGRIAVRVPFASSFITAAEARDFACKLIELAEELDGTL